MAWVGGKKALREEVLARFPLYYERYIEVFGGGGWVLFHKPPGTDFEVYNDLNGNLAALYRAVRDHPRELQERLRYVLNSREDFMRLKQVLEHPEGMEEVARAAAFYQVIRYSYAAGCGSVPFPVSWTVKMKKKQKETQDILSYHTQAAGCSDKARAKASGGRQPIEECGRTGL